MQICAGGLTFRRAANFGPPPTSKDRMLMLACATRRKCCRRPGERLEAVNCHSCQPRHHGDSDQEDKRLDARFCHCHPPPDKLRAESTPWSALPSQQVWQLSDVRRDPPRLCRTTRHWDFADKLRLTRQHFLEFRCFAPTIRHY